AAMSSSRSRACRAAFSTALPATKVARDAKVPVQTGEESVFELSYVIHSYGTPSASATIWLWIVFEPLPMSLVPEKTSTRPSGLILIQACDGSPFWFIPVGYSIAENPRPVCLAISDLRSASAARRGARGAGRLHAGRASSSRSRPAARARPHL